MKKNPSNLSSTSKFKNGYFKPYFMEKYVGDAREIKYRSGWEYKFMVYCDREPGIKRWSSEPMPIPYYSPVDKKMHKYWIDFWLDFGDGVKRLVEIKPFAQTKKPVYKENSKSPKKMENYIYEAKQYAVNMSKWKAAEEFCKQAGWKFLIITEKSGLLT